MLGKNVMSAGRTRPNPTNKRRLRSINEHFKKDSNAYGQAQSFCNSLVSCHAPEMRVKIVLDRDTYFHYVILAQARIQAAFNWTPACAGVTIV
jgi:hypothetical protein